MPRVALDSEFRCTHNSQTGQCKNQVLPGDTLCEDHSRISEKRKLRAYHLTNQVINASSERHLAVDEIKTLREEIAITRALIETRLNLCQSDLETMTAIPVVKDMLVALEKLVSSSHKMEFALGNLLNKGAMLTLAQEIINIISTELEGIPNRNEIVERVGQRIVSAIADQENKTK